MFFDADAAFADFVAGRGNARFDRALIPGGDVDVGVRSLDPQIGFSAEVVSLRPFVGVSRQRGGYGDSQDCKRQALKSGKVHSILRGRAMVRLRAIPSALPLRRGYENSVRLVPFEFSVSSHAG